MSQAHGYAEREPADIMLDGVRQAARDPDTEVTVGTDKGYDAGDQAERANRSAELCDGTTGCGGEPKTPAAVAPDWEDLQHPG